MPAVTATLSAMFITGNSGEDAIEILCTAVATNGVISASYQFAWIKDDIPINVSSNRIVVRMYNYKNNTLMLIIKYQ